MGRRILWPFVSSEVMERGPTCWPHWYTCCKTQWGWATFHPYAPQFNHCPLCWKVFLYGNFIAQEKRKPKKRSKNLLQILSATKHSDKSSNQDTSINATPSVFVVLYFMKVGFFFLLIYIHSIFTEAFIIIIIFSPKHFGFV